MMFAVPIETNLYVIFGLSCFVCSIHTDKLACYIWFVMLCLQYSYRQTCMLYLVCHAMFAALIETNLYVIFGLLHYVCSTHKDKLVCYNLVCHAMSAVLIDTTLYLVCYTMFAVLIETN